MSNAAAFDPYVELDVPRDAGEPQIKAAYRKRAKVTHPDANGGDDEPFLKTKLALIVLTDPAKRERFDNTGTIEDDKPDNVRAAALQIVERHMGTLVNAFIQSGGRDASKDPRRMDVPKVIVRLIRAEVKQAHQGVVTFEEMLAFLCDMRGRFHLADPEKAAEDPVLRGYDAQIKRTEAQIATLREAIICHEKAIEIISAYRFDADKTSVAVGSYDPTRKWIDFERSP